MDVMMQNWPAWAAAGIVLAAFVSAPAAVAQSGETDIGEVGAFTGGAFGGGAHGAAGGSAGTAFSRHGMLLFETSFMPLGNNTIQEWPARSTVVRSYLWDFAIDSHIRIPVRERWAPYAIVGTGLLWNTVRQQTLNLQGSPVIYNFNQFSGVFHTGGGVRYYLGRNWGIRPEVKVIVTRQTYTRLSLGVFYVTSGEIP
jgi:outer membrane protein with beta-barrel domain